MQQEKMQQKVKFSGQSGFRSSGSYAQLDHATTQVVEDGRYAVIVALKSTVDAPPVVLSLTYSDIGDLTDMLARAAGNFAKARSSGDWPEASMQ